MKFEFEIMEKYEGTVEVIADNEEEALAIAEQRYENGEYSNSVDLIDSDVSIVEEL